MYAFMLWFFSAIVGYFSTSLSGVADKFLVSDRIKNPVAYSFLLSSFSLASFVLAPLGLRFLPFEALLVFFISGIFFAWSLLFLFRAFRIGEVSKIMPIVGVVSAIITLLPSLVRACISGDVPLVGLLAFLLLLSGAVLISFSDLEKDAYSRESFGLSLLSGALLAFFYLTLKVGEGSGANFISGLLWSRLGIFLGGLSMLLVPSYRHDIASFVFETMLPAIRSLWKAPFLLRRHKKENVPTPTWMIFVAGKMAGGIGAFLIIFATYRGPVAIVQALIGVQFAFVFLIALFLSKKFPDVFEERMSRTDWIRKGVAFVCISLGMWFSLKGGSALF